MKINTAELRVVIDVDGTLIQHVHPSRSAMPIDYYGQWKHVMPMYNNISLLKAHKARGYEVSVWSANGHKWAENVIRALNLVEYVDDVSAKPLKYIDDLPADNWMQRVFVPEDI